MLVYLAMLRELEHTSCLLPCKMIKMTLLVSSLFNHYRTSLITPQLSASNNTEHHRSHHKSLHPTTHLDRTHPSCHVPPHPIVSLATLCYHDASCYCYIISFGSSRRLLMMHVISIDFNKGNVTLPPRSKRLPKCV